MLNRSRNEREKIRHPTPRHIADPAISRTRVASFSSAATGRRNLSVNSNFYLSESIVVVRLIIGYRSVKFRRVNFDIRHDVSLSRRFNGRLLASAPRAGSIPPLERRKSFAPFFFGVRARNRYRDRDSLRGRGVEQIGARYYIRRRSLEPRAPPRTHHPLGIKRGREFPVGVGAPRTPGR